MDTKELDKRLKQVDSVFSPSTPIEQRDLFFGRIDEIKEILSTVSERGQHCVLYGDRGVGKTSLANMVFAILQTKYVCVKVNCTRNDTFRNLWEKALSKITFTHSVKSIGFDASTIKTNQLNLFLPPASNLQPTDIENVFSLLNNNIVLIFDEYDSITDKNIKQQFSDTIKLFSDSMPKVTIILVGIGNDVNDLLFEHLSLERCLKQVNLPNMSDTELGQIIDFGFESLSLRIENGVRKRIIEFSSGYPHYTHSLSKHTAISTISENQKLSSFRHFDQAVSIAIRNSQQQIRNDFQKAIISSKEIAHFENVLYAAANAVIDNFGNSTANQILDKFNEITKGDSSREAITYHLGTLCKPERGQILTKIGTSKNVKYRFTNTLMKNYVKLNHYKIANNLGFS